MASIDQESQSDTFLSTEGDAWFYRNENQLSKDRQLDIDFLSKTLISRKSEIRNILEIGCAGGHKLAALAHIFGATGYGIDPSKAAIQSARKSAKLSDSKLNFVTGLATDLPYPDAKFDLVFFGFCLYLVPPKEIFKAVMEADRVLKSGGYLAIVDFDYGQLKVNPYKHADGVYSFKNNYSQFFTSSGYFHLVSKWSFSHLGNSFETDKDERLAIEVLFKEFN